MKHGIHKKKQCRKFEGNCGLREGEYQDTDKFSLHELTVVKATLTCTMNPGQSHCDKNCFDA